MSLPDGQHHRRNSSLERRDPYSSPSVYYDEDAVRRQLLGARNRTVSSVRLLHNKPTHRFNANELLRIVYQTCSGDSLRGYQRRLSHSPYQSWLVHPPILVPLVLEADILPSR